MKMIMEGEILLAKVITTEDFQPGLMFHSNEADNIQVSTWIHNKSKWLKPHFHNPIQRSTVGTQEVIVVLSGSIHVDIYDTRNCLASELTLRSGEVLISLNGGHGYFILDNNTRVVEIKNGPYFGQSEDKSMIENRCTEYLGENT